MVKEYLKKEFVPQYSYLKMGSHGNALAASFFKRRVRLRPRTYDFHCSIEKRHGELGPYVSFNESHVLYSYGRQSLLEYVWMQ